MNDDQKRIPDLQVAAALAAPGRLTLRSQLPRCASRSHIMFTLSPR